MNPVRDQSVMNQEKSNITTGAQGAPISNGMNKDLLINNPELKFFGSLFVILAVLLAGSYVLGSKVDKEAPPAEQAYDPFDSVVLEARAAYVYDVTNKTVLFAKNEEQRFPLASLTKVMSALVAYEKMPVESSVTINAEALAAEGDHGLRAGEKWTLKNLLDFTLTTSSNDGAKAVALAIGSAGTASADAEKDFVRQMNRLASEINMKNTYYFNETGLDEDEIKGGAYGTAKDMATLFEYILVHHPRLLEATQEDVISVRTFDGRSLTANNTDEIVGNIPGIKASKTGYTDIAGGNLVVAFDPELGRTIIVSVLGSGRDSRFSDTQKLVDASLEAITNE